MMCCPAHTKNEVSCGVGVLYSGPVECMAIRASGVQATPGVAEALGGSYVGVVLPKLKTLRFRSHTL